MNDQDERFYRSLLLIRRVEEEVARIYATDVIKSPVHLSIGQEAASVAVCDALRPDDVAFGTYRGHALYLAKGGDLRAMVAELYGKVTGCARGKGGSMHLIDVKAGAMGASAVVGTTIPHAIGYAKAIRIRKEDRIVACFFGDGALEEGAYHESMNFAVLHNLPVLFVCENNLYAIHAPLPTRQGSTDLVGRPASYGMPATRIADGDPWKLREAVVPWIAEMRAGRMGPAFVETVAYRWKEHVGPNEDFAAGYRSRADAEPWYARDPVALAAARLTPDSRQRIETEVGEAIRDAFAYAEQSPFPDDAELGMHTWGDEA